MHSCVFSSFLMSNLEQVGGRASADRRTCAAAAEGRRTLSGELPRVLNHGPPLRPETCNTSSKLLVRLITPFLF